MRPKPRVLVAGALAVVALGACGSSSNKSSSTTEAPKEAATTTTVEAEVTTTTAAKATGTVVVAVGTTSLGDALVDKDGLTLYQFENDKDGTIACTAACTKVWPPVVATDPPVAGPGISDDAKFTTVTRDDGTKQLAVNGHPLYRFAADTAPGDIGGQKIGNVWYVTGIKGEKLGETDDS